MIYSSVNNGDVKKSNINNNLNSDRIFLFDNIKFFLMLLCVIGHFALYDKTHFAFIRSLFLFIHTFHMQLFIFISGLFYSKLKVKYNETKNNTIENMWLLDLKELQKYF